MEFYRNKILTTLAYSFKLSKNDSHPLLCSPKWFLSFSYHVEHIIIMKLIFLTHLLERELSYACMTSTQKQERNKKGKLSTHYWMKLRLCFRGTMRWNNCTLIFHFPPIVFAFLVFLYNLPEAVTYVMSGCYSLTWKLTLINFCMYEVVFFSKSLPFCD